MYGRNDLAVLAFCLTILSAIVVRESFTELPKGRVRRLTAAAFSHGRRCNPEGMAVRQ
jgi:hypothetical protein